MIRYIEIRYGLSIVKLVLKKARAYLAWHQLFSVQKLDCIINCSVAQYANEKHDDLTVTLSGMDTMVTFPSVFSK